jgi:polyisoprenoid-binding protein YceI
MTDETGLTVPVRAGNGSSPRRRHWLRWTVAGLTALVILAAAAVGAFIKLQPSPAALRLPAGAAQPPAGPTAGRWDVAAGSLAGFRVRESALGISNDVVGRTSAVTGALVVSGDRVTAAAFRVDLTAIRVGGKAESQLATSLGTRQYPVATFTLTGAVPLSSGFDSGATVTLRAAGQLTMHGLSRPVTVTISGRRDGSELQVAGTIPVAFSGWRIAGPKGFGILGSLASHGAAEFFLVLRRQ